MATRDSLSFLKSRRLRRRSEYERVRRDGTTRHGKLLMLNVAPMENFDPSLAGVVTARRLGGAVVRNRVRRRLPEIVGQHQPQLRPGFCFVLVATTAAV